MNHLEAKFSYKILVHNQRDQRLFILKLPYHNQKLPTKNLIITKQEQAVSSNNSVLRRINISVAD